MGGRGTRVGTGAMFLGVLLGTSALGYGVTQATSSTGADADRAVTACAPSHRARHRAPRRPRRPRRRRPRPPGPRHRRAPRTNRSRRPSRRSVPRHAATRAHASWAGDHGARVRELQSRLRQVAWYFGNVDDDYGRATVAAVRGFQAKREIAVTGYVDRRTLGRLHAMTHTPTADELADRAREAPPRTRSWMAGAGPAGRCASTRRAAPSGGSSTGRWPARWRCASVRRTRHPRRAVPRRLEVA